MFLWLKTLYRKRAVTWPFIFYTIIWTLSILHRIMDLTTKKVQYFNFIFLNIRNIVINLSKIYKKGYLLWKLQKMISFTLLSFLT